MASISGGLFDLIDAGDVDGVRALLAEQPWLAAERDENVLGRLARGLVTSGRLVLAKVALASGTALAVGLAVGLARIGRCLGGITLGFAQGLLLLLLLLFFLGPSPGRPVSLRSISTVVWLECHRILLCAG